MKTPLRWSQIDSNSIQIIIEYGKGADPETFILSRYGNKDILVDRDSTSYFYRKRVIELDGKTYEED